MREATERPWAEYHSPLTVCAEHKRVIELGTEADEHLTALYTVQEWINADAKPDKETILQHHPYTMREKAEAEYWPVAVAQKAAGLIADQPQGEKPLTREQAERLAEHMLRSDALLDARVILEDSPEEMFGARERWAMVAALLAAGEEATGAHRRYKREIAIR